ncbi:MAG: undecaprenyl-diphosphate phosphatase [Bacteroidales bacterium]|nr:undecaprenyl-diphosphate phosphatase [Bacteroidales bacterium]
MEWWQALVLGMVQGLTEFLPVSSSGHLMLVRELLGVDGEGFLDFTVAVHFATVVSTVVVFRKVIVELLKGLFKFRYNDETDYVCKIIVSMIPVGIVGVFFKDSVEALFGNGVTVVGICLLVTAFLLLLSDLLASRLHYSNNYRNGISYWQAFVVGLGQAFAVAPGLSRSGTTIATGLVAGVKRDRMAQFSFLMVLVPIIGEQLLDCLDMLVSPAGEAVASVGALPLIVGAVSAFLSGLFACKVMIAIVKKAKLGWFALYCAVIGVAILVFGF